MIKSKKQMFIVIGAFLLTLLLGSATYAFFNYTRTGSSNVIKVGRISFSTNQSHTVNLTNAFPIDKTKVNIDTDNVDDVVITITGDTTYDDGVEYLLTATNVSNTVNNKKMPISINVTATEGIGTEDEDYYNNRGGDDAIYRIVSDETINSGDELVVGYIPKGSTGVNGTVTIKAYLDKDKIAISDTYPSGIKRVLNTNMTSEEMNNCVTYFETNYYYYFNSNNVTGESFCTGSGKWANKTFQEELDNNGFSSNVLEYLIANNIVIVLGENGTTNEWLDGRTLFTTEEWNSLHDAGIGFKIKVEANEGIWTDYIHGYERVQRAIRTKLTAKQNACNPTFVDNIDTENDTSDDIIYLSGTPECVDMNYVWYSGKLWRIVAIYPDGSMKLITEDAVTTIYWGSDTEYDGSWIYQWLNEDFYDTLVNPNDIIVNSTWNYSTNPQPVRTETIATQKTKEAPVGILNKYELYNTYRCIGYDNQCNYNNLYRGYLNTDIQWWLLTPTSSSQIGYVKTYVDNLAPSTRAGGVRPSIVIKPEVVFTGDGTISSPYKIVGDRDDPVNNTTLLSNRSVGEYVKFDNDIYRIVEINNGKVKLIMASALKDANNTNLSKLFASSFVYGKEGNTENDDYSDYYLNHTWYGNITPQYQNMLVDDTYYLGQYYNANYKTSICKDSDLDSVTIKNCTKYTSSDEDMTFTGKVGLPRSGEMFASQLKTGTSSTSVFFLINIMDNNYTQQIFSGGYISGSGLSTGYEIRPTITLKSGVKITGGTGYIGGNVNSPFEISE